ncbi:hypothetical protein KFL_006310090 [Klebsormidium nitens]|uniref:Uncharacterized protein n=1 Tax=Klebsormidium nitens TaxID=105231 RepID=A0A1Y1ILN9_KLENI|nr:hypothetical protein KFL_006310090 [Klebsormidium nitens]|eukprot:GAQ90359.1 hypothetical protein KFL_006310090 [Klebsormidium nitens]
MMEGNLMASRQSGALLILLLALSSTVQHAEAFDFAAFSAAIRPTVMTLAAGVVNWRSVTGALSNVAERVANERERRGDFAGAERLRQWSGSYTHGPWVASGGLLAATGLAQHTRAIDLQSTLADLQRLKSLVEELLRLSSDEARLSWLSRNWDTASRVAERLSKDSINLLGQSGLVRGFLDAVYREAVDKKLARDVLGVASGDVMTLVSAFQQLIETRLREAVGGGRDEL